MNKILYIIATSIVFICIFLYIGNYIISGQLAGKNTSNLDICTNLKDNEICVCEKYKPTICHIKINPLKKNEAIYY